MTGGRDLDDVTGGRDLDDVTGCVVDAAMKLHTALGPGLLESVYETVLARDLERRGLRVERQKPVAFDYDGLHFSDGLRLDRLAPVHTRQVLTYLRLLGLPVGLLINFGVPSLRDGIRRIVNNLPASSSPHLRVNRSRDGS